MQILEGQGSLLKWAPLDAVKIRQVAEHVEQKGRVGLLGINAVVQNGYGILYWLWQPVGSSRPPRAMGCRTGTGSEVAYGRAS